MIAIALLAATALPSADAVSCRFTARPIGAGEAITAQDTAAGPCSDRLAPRRLRYDAAARVARAAVDLASGEELGHVFLPQRPAVLPGEPILLTAAVGPVTIARTVTALQPGRAGRRLFVRDEAGKVFSVPAPTELRP